ERAEREPVELALGAGEGHEHPRFPLLREQAEVETGGPTRADVTHLAELSIAQRRAVLRFDIDRHWSACPWIVAGAGSIVPSRRPDAPIGGGSATASRV